MNIHEHQAKELLKEFEAPVSRGVVILSLNELDEKIKQLKSTATSLREELESLRFEKDAAVQQAIQRSTDEINQLMKTSSELRDSMVSQKFEFETRFQKQMLEKVDEHRHLQDTIVKLRKELDQKHV